MGTNIGDVLVVRRSGRNPLFQLLDLAVREGIAIGRHRRKTTLVLDCSQEAVVARRGYHAGMRVQLYIGGRGRSIVAAYAEILQHGLNGATKRKGGGVTA